MNPEAQKPRILVVDDEPAMLRALARTLGRKYEVVTADGAGAAIPLLQEAGPYAAVLTDERMPGMAGTDLLEVVRTTSPTTVRLLITGSTDVNAARGAVNRGEVFRILLKPCDDGEVLAALDAAVAQHQLQGAARAHREEALAGSLRMLLDLLGLASPAALGRARRLRHLTRAVCDRLAVAERAALETAAVFSQVGALALPSSLAAKLAEGRLLNEDEQFLAGRVPRVTEQLLGHLPGLERVRDILARCDEPFNDASDDKTATPLPARILKVLLATVQLEGEGLAPADVLDDLERRSGAFDPMVLDALAACLHLGRGPRGAREMSLREVAPGMVFVEDVRSRAGDLLIRRGQEVTPALLDAIWQFTDNVAVHEPVRVTVAPLTLSN